MPGAVGCLPVQGSFSTRSIVAQLVAMAEPVSVAVSVSMEKVAKDSELFSTTSPESSVRTLETALED